MRLLALLRSSGHKNRLLLQQCCSRDAAKQHGRMSEGYNTPKIGRSGPTSPAASEKTTSSRAVLAALRALQDKIARLEGERAEAVHATSELRARLREAEARLDSVGAAPTPVRGGGDELDELREAQHRLEREYTERDAAAKAA